jgi:hypothetical protein
MLNLRKIELEDRQWINPILKEHDISGCHENFGNLFAWREINNTKVAKVNEFLVVKQEISDLKDVYLYPMGKGNVKPIIEEIINSADSDRLLIAGLSREQVNELNELFPGKFIFKEAKMDFDYIYYIEKLVTLKGKKLHRKRNHTITTGIGKDIEIIRKQLKTWQIPEKNLDRIFIPTKHSGRLNVGRYTKWMEDAMMVRNSLGTCSMYSAFGMEDMNIIAKLYSSATGDEIESRELMREGEKAFTYKKIANVKEGFTRKDDSVPKLWLRRMKTPEGDQITTDYYNEKVLTENDFEKILDDYYDERGYSISDGIPTKEKLKEIDINL